MNDFKKLDINESILKVISEMGYESPTEIQEKAIPLLMESNKDFVGQAQTGTGKTAAFVIPLLEKISLKDQGVQALILAPTRELANQVENEIKKLSKYMKIKSTCVYGGTAYDGQVSTLKNDRPQIVVGTPGRVLDLIKRGSLVLDNAKFCVLDEADEMLNMGFLEDVQLILNKFEKKRQLMMFSATMPSPITKMIKKTFNNPNIVYIEKKSLSNDDIEQRYFVVRDKHFKEALSRIIDNDSDMYGIIFCRTKIETREVSDDLKKRGHSVEVLNGDMGQMERDLAMRKFKSAKSRIMVCTDVAARGIDVNNLTHVINYGLPRDNESYVHRIGRTGRAGMKGVAYTLVGPKSAHAIKTLEKHVNKKITKSDLPTVEVLKRSMVKKELVGAQRILEAITEKGDGFRTEESFSLFNAEFGDLNQKDLLKMMFVWKFNKEMRRYNNLADIETDNSISPGKPPKKSRSGRTRGDRIMASREKKRDYRR